MEHVLKLLHLGEQSREHVLRVLLSLILFEELTLVLGNDVCVVNYFCRHRFPTKKPNQNKEIETITTASQVQVSLHMVDRPESRVAAEDLVNRRDDIVSA